MADVLSSIRRVRQLTKKEPSTGDFLECLYNRLNEDPSRYRAKDSQGNSIPFEIYQSDEERAIAILDPNGKAHRLRSACGLARAWLWRGTRRILAVLCFAFDEKLSFGPRL